MKNISKTKRQKVCQSITVAEAIKLLLKSNLNYEFKVDDGSGWLADEIYEFVIDDEEKICYFR